VITEVEEMQKAATTLKKVTRGAIAVIVAGIVIQPAALAGTQAPQRGARPAAPAAQSSSVRAVGTVMQVMHAIVIPASDAVFKAGGDPPADDKGWTTAENQAVALAESGNLLMIGNRVRDRGDWMKMSRALVDAAATAVKAAQAKNADAMSTASDAVYETCEACHLKYLKK
jgi:hypothetical protein